MTVLPFARTERAYDVETRTVVPFSELAARMAARERIRSGKFFLVRNDGAASGERWRCGRCGAKHPYLTVLCVEAPFRGLDTALVKYVSVSSDETAARRLAPYLTPYVPDLSTMHPAFARQLRPPERGEDFYGLVVGLVEPITERQALRFAEAIRFKARSPKPASHFILT